MSSFAYFGGSELHVTFRILWGSWFYVNFCILLGSWFYVTFCILWESEFYVNSCILWGSEFYVTFCILWGCNSHTMPPWNVLIFSNPSWYEMGFLLRSKLYWVVVSNMLYMFTLLLPGKMIQFDLRIFFKLGWNFNHLTNQLYHLHLLVPPMGLVVFKADMDRTLEEVLESLPQMDSVGRLSGLADRPSQVGGWEFSPGKNRGEKKGKAWEFRPQFFLWKIRVVGIISKTCLDSMVASFLKIYSHGCLRWDMMLHR